MGKKKHFQYNIRESEQIVPFKQYPSQQLDPEVIFKLSLLYKWASSKFFPTILQHPYQEIKY